MKNNYLKIISVFIFGVIIMFCLFGCKSQDNVNPVNTTAQNEVDYDKHPVLVFGSFDGGGYEYSAKVEDEDIVSFTTKRDYGDQNLEEIDGASYDFIFTFTGIKAGTTEMKIEARSPIAAPEDYYYEIVVDDSLNVKITQKDAE